MCTTPPAATATITTGMAIEAPCRPCDRRAVLAALKLQLWLSPAFPVGSFAYSHGLEQAVEAGDVHDASTLTAWLRDLLGHGSIRSDTLLAGAAWRAGAAGDMAALLEANALALALSPSRERHLETSSQGSAFVAAARAAWPCAALDALPPAVAYPVALGATAAGHGIDRDATCAAFAQAFVAALVSAAVRLGPIGQTGAQQAMAALLPAVLAMAAAAREETLDDLGGCALRSDIAAMRHETQYSRLFRS